MIVSVISKRDFAQEMRCWTAAIALAVIAAASGSALARTQVDDSTGRLVDQSNAASDDSNSNSEQTQQVRPSPEIGPAAAQKYFIKRKNRRPADEDSHQSSTAVAPSEPSYGDHSLSLGIGGFLAGDTYSWGANAHNTGSGRITAEMTYRMAALSPLADWSLRVDYLGYGLPEGNAAELAFSPVLMIPEATSKFPVYFGLGAGPGVFVQQVSQQSSICMNYQLFGGLRFYDVLENTGFFMEAGLKNNFLLTSAGQFNGTYLATGAVFTF